MAHVHQGQTALAANMTPAQIANHVADWILTQVTTHHPNGAQLRRSRSAGWTVRLEGDLSHQGQQVNNNLDRTIFTAAPRQWSHWFRLVGGRPLRNRRHRFRGWEWIPARRNALIAALTNAINNLDNEYNNLDLGFDLARTTVTYPAPRRSRRRRRAPVRFVPGEGGAVFRDERGRLRLRGGAPQDPAECAKLLCGYTKTFAASFYENSRSKVADVFIAFDTVSPPQPDNGRCVFAALNDQLRRAGGEQCKPDGPDGFFKWTNEETGEHNGGFEDGKSAYDIYDVAEWLECDAGLVYMDNVSVWTITDAWKVKRKIMSPTFDEEAKRAEVKYPNLELRILMDKGHAYSVTRVKSMKKEDFDLIKSDFKDVSTKAVEELMVHGPVVDEEARTTDALKEQIKLCQRIRRGMVIIGPGGSGKTYTINETIREDPNTRVLTVAHSNMASTNLTQGSTIHTAFGLLVEENKDEPRDLTIRQLDVCMQKVQQRHPEGVPHVVVIDEIGNLSATIFRRVDQVLRRWSGVDRPFGGVFMIVQGDTLQLQAVDCPTTALFSDTFKEWEASAPGGFLSYAYLEETFGKRYTDKAWSELLGRIRRGMAHEADVDFLYERTCSTRKDCAALLKCRYVDMTIMNKLNRCGYNEELARRAKSDVMTRSVDYEHGVKAAGSNFRRNPLRSTRNTTLFVGARVMYKSNKLKKTHGICRGQLGIVRTFMKSQVDPSAPPVPVVEFDLSDDDVSVAVDYEECTGKVLVLPLCAAAGVTIHKWQGSTAKDWMNVVVNLKGLSKQEGGHPSMLYVALSRNRSPEKLTLLTTFKDQKSDTDGALAKKFLASLINNIACPAFDQWVFKKRPGEAMPQDVRNAMRAASGASETRELSPEYSFLSSMDEIMSNCGSIGALRVPQNHLSMQTGFFDFETYRNERNGKHEVYMAMVLTANCGRRRGQLNAGRFEALDEKSNCPAKKCTSCNHAMSFEFEEIKADHVGFATSSSSPVSRAALIEEKSPDMCYREWCACCGDDMGENGEKDPGDALLTFILSHEKASGKFGSLSQFVHGSSVARMHYDWVSYNGSAYDMQMIFERLLRRPEHASGEIQVTGTFKGSKIVAIKVFTQNAKGAWVLAHRFIDLLLIMGSGSLAKNCMAFLGSSEKSFFPHALMSATVISRLASGHSIPEDVELDHFKSPSGASRLVKAAAQDPSKLKADCANPAKRRVLLAERRAKELEKAEAVRIINLVKSGEYNIHQELHRYARFDVSELLRLTKKYDQELNALMGHDINVTAFSTAANVSRYGFLTHLDKSVVITSNRETVSHTVASRQTAGFISKIYKLTRPVYEAVSQSLIGGKTVPRVLRYKSCQMDILDAAKAAGKITARQKYLLLDDCLIDFDVVSQYVSMMMPSLDTLHIYPFGRSHIYNEATSEGAKVLKDYNKFMNNHAFWERRFKKPLKSSLKAKGTYHLDASKKHKDRRMCIVRADFYINDRELEPRFARLDEERGTRVWDCGEYKNTWITCIDAAITIRTGRSQNYKGKVAKMGSKFRKIHEVIEWEESGNLFDNWCGKTFKLKKEAADEYNKAKKTCAKLAGNTVYGAMAQRVIRNSIRVLNDIPRPDEEGDQDMNSVDKLLDRGEIVTDVLNYEKWAKREHNFMIAATEQLSGGLENDRGHMSSTATRNKDLQAEIKHNLKTELVTDDGVRVAYADLGTWRDPAQHLLCPPRHLGSFILSWTRWHLHAFHCAHNPFSGGKHNLGVKRPRNSNEQPAFDDSMTNTFKEALMRMPKYGDTDSLFLLKACVPEMDQAHILGDGPGQMNDDCSLEGCDKKGYGFIQEMIVLGPKCYAKNIVFPNGVEKVEWAIRGIPKNSVCEKMRKDPMSVFRAAADVLYDPTRDTADMEKYDEVVQAMQLYGEFTQFRRVGFKPTGPQLARGLDVGDVYTMHQRRQMTRKVYSGRRVLKTDPAVAQFFQPTVPVSASEKWQELWSGVDALEYCTESQRLGAHGGNYMRTKWPEIYGGAEYDQAFKALTK